MTEEFKIKKTRNLRYNEKEIIKEIIEIKKENDDFETFKTELLFQLGVYQTQVDTNTKDIKKIKKELQIE